MPNETCPSADQLKAYLLGQLRVEQIDEVSRHVDHCPPCEDTVTALELADDTFLSGLRGQKQGKYQGDDDYQRALEFVKQLGGGPSAAKKQGSADKAPPIGNLREYELLEKLGEGGMGAVYKARHTKLDKVVAIKLLPAERMKDQSAVTRFEREMRAVGKLEHPNIVRAMDAGEVDGMHFLVMEYVEGLDLSQLVKQCGPLPIADACELIRQAAVGLDEAHDNQMVHRDIKPSNIMLCRSGTRRQPPVVKILDMGLALLSEAHSPDARGLTNTGQMMGTLDYMAPEQGGDSHEVDIRADIYALGASLYKLLCGEVIYHGEKYQTPVQKMMALATQPAPPIQQRRKEIPAELAVIVHRMLEKNPARRFATPEDVAHALAPFCAGANLAKLLSSAGIDVAPASDNAQSGTQPSIASPNADTGVSGDARSSAKPPVAHRNGANSQLSAAVNPPASPHIVVQQAKTKPTAGRGKLPPWLPLAIGGGVLGAGGITALLAAMIFYFQTPTGTLRVEINDPSVEVVVKGSEIVLKQADKEEVKLQAGEHTLVVKRGDFTFETKQLVLKRGETTTVKVDLLPGKIQVVQAGNVIGSGTLAKSPDEIKAFATDSPTIDRNGVTPEAGGWKMVATGDRSVALFELPKPGVDNCLVIYRANVKTQDVGKRAYLEMKCRFSDHAYHGEYFSKGFQNAVTGTTDWATLEIPFRLEKGQSPDSIKLNVVIEGGGTVWIKDVELLKRPLPGGTQSVAKGPMLKPGRWLELLPLVDLKEDVVAGRWQRRNGHLVSNGDKGTRLALPVIPQGDYELSVRFQAIGGHDTVAVIVPIGDRQAAIFPDGPRTGLEVIDGKGVWPPQNATAKVSKPLVNGKSHTALISVATESGKAKVQCWLDGKVLVDWTGPTGSLSLFRGWSLGDDRRVGIGGLANTFESVRLRMLTGQARLLRAEAAVVGANEDETVKSPPRLAIRATLTGHADQVWAVAFAPEGNKVASGGLDNTVILWDVAKEAELRKLRGHADMIRGIAFAPDGEILATASKDKTLKLWNVAEGGPAIWTLRGHTNIVTGVAWSPDGATILSSSDDQTARLWDVTKIATRSTLKTHKYWVTSVAFSADKKLAATGGWDGVVKLWDVNTSEEVRELSADAPVWSVAFSPDGRSIVAGCHGGAVRCWDTATGEQRWHFDVPAGACGAAFHPDGGVLAVADGEGGVHLLDANSGKQFAVVKEHTGVVRAVAFSPDGASLASAGDDKTVKLWDVPNNDVAPVAPTSPKGAAADYDRFANGKWVPLLGPHEGIAQDGISTRNGVITLNDAMFRDSDADAVQAKDMIVRAQVKGMGSLATRCTGGNYTFWVGEGVIGINRNEPETTVLASRQYTIDTGKFHEYAFATIGERLIGFIDGRRVLDTTDDKWDVRGPLLIHAHQTTSQFKNVEVMSLEGDLLPVRDPLARWVGGWDVTRTLKLPGQPARESTGVMVVTRAPMSDFYTTLSKFDFGVNSIFVSRFLPEKNAIENWSFWSTGLIEEYEKPVDVETGAQTVAKPTPIGGQMTGHIRFLDKDTSEMHLVTAAPDGKPVSETISISKRRDGRLPFKPIDLTSDGPADDTPALAALNGMVGLWDVETQIKPSKFEPEGRRVTGRNEIKWYLGGRFLLCQEYTSADKLDAVWLWGYEAKTNTYPFVMFQSSGNVATWSEVWDADTKTFKGKAHGLPKGWTGEGENRIVDENTIEFWATIKNDRGEVMFGMQGTKRRVKAVPPQAAAMKKLEFRLAQYEPADGWEEMTDPITKKKIYVDNTAAVGNADVAAARVVTNELGEPAIAIDFAGASQKKIGEFSSGNVGKLCAIFIDGKLNSAPVIRAKFSDKTEIWGKFTRQQAAAIATGISTK